MVRLTGRVGSPPRRLAAASATVLLYAVVAALWWLWPEWRPMPSADQPRLEVFDLPLPPEPPVPPPDPVEPPPPRMAARPVPEDAGGSAPSRRLEPPSLAAAAPLPSSPLPTGPSPLAMPEGDVRADGLATVPDLGTSSVGTGGGTGGLGTGSGDGVGSGRGGRVEVRGASWIHKPTDEEMRPYWPVRAALARRSGMVDLMCVVRESGIPDRCWVRTERPRGYGFGAAAVRISPTFRIRPIYIGGRPTAIPIHVPVGFNYRRSHR